MLFTFVLYVCGTGQGRWEKSKIMSKGTTNEKSRLLFKPRVESFTLFPCNMVAVTLYEADGTYSDSNTRSQSNASPKITATDC